MSFKRVPAGDAVTWISEAIRLVFANPAPFLLMGLALSVIGLVPILGGLVMLVAGPAFYAGIASAARTQDQGGSADFNQLLSGFQAEGKIGSLLALCLPQVAVIVIAIMVGIVLAIVLGAAAVVSSGNVDPNAGLVALIGFGGVATMVVVLLPVALIAAALVFFAIPRVMFDGVPAFAAMRESAQAALANVGAFLITLFAVIGAYVVAVLILSVISSVLAGLVVGIVFAPIFGSLTYVAWREVFGDSGEDSSAQQGSSPPPPPATPNNPPPNIEA